MGNSSGGPVAYAHHPPRAKVYVSFFDLENKMIDMSKPLTPEIRAELLQRRASFGAGDKSIQDFRLQASKSQTTAKPPRNRKRSI